MDWPTSTRTDNSLAGEARPNASSKLFFAAADYPSDPLGILSGWQTKRGPKSRLTRKRTYQRIALVLAAAGTAGLAEYASIGVPSWNKPVTSVAHDSIAAARGIASINTLPPPNLLKPLSPVQAAQINAERPFTDRPDVPASRFLLRTDAVNRERAITCLTQAVYYEAAGEGLDGERAVAQVVLNRVRHPGFPSTICGVVYQGAEKTTGCQFSFTCDGSMQRTPAPALWTRSRQIADEALKGRVFAAVGHATHYHADYVLPYWADSLDKSVRVGRHIFYRLPKIFGDAAAFSQRYGGIEQALIKPSSTIVLPPAVSTEQLATALLTDGVQDSTRDAEKASPQASSSLLIDATRGALLADGSGTAVSARSHRTKASSECSLQPENGKVVPLGATVMRSTVGGATCQGQ